MFLIPERIFMVSSGQRCSQIFHGCPRLLVRQFYDFLWIIGIAKTFIADFSGVLEWRSSSTICIADYSSLPSIIKMIPSSSVFSWT